MRTVILYHANCPDGFGGAFAAWKKFGDAAEYYPVKHSDLPEEVAGATVYLIDLCYRKELMDELLAKAASLVVLDHHEGLEDVVRTMPNYVYDAEHSGAAIAWTYFHPDIPLPKLLAHIEDDDLFRFLLPDTKPLMAYLSVQPFTFEFWDEIAGMLEHPEAMSVVLEKARTYREYFDLLAQQSAERAKLVQFEGYEIYVAQTHPMKTMVSSVGNILATRKGPFALVLQIRPNGIAVSMRGDGTIDLTKVAAKYGGSGHPSSSAFLLPWGTPLPWTYVGEAHTD